ncbi:MAG: hypothetical protein AB8E15_07495 [Bdellovibrionales bacterium]
MLKVFLVAMLLVSNSLMAVVVVDSEPKTVSDGYPVHSVENSGGIVTVIPHKKQPQHECKIPVELVLRAGFVSVIEFSDSISRNDINLQCFKSEVETLKDFSVEYRLFQY